MYSFPGYIFLNSFFDSKQSKNYHLTKTFLKLRIKLNNVE